MPVPLPAADPGTLGLWPEAAAARLHEVSAVLKRERSSLNLGPPLHDFMEFSRLMGFEDVWEFERRFADSP